VIGARHAVGAQQRTAIDLKADHRNCPLRNRKPESRVAVKLKSVSVHAGQKELSLDRMRSCVLVFPMRIV